MQNLQSFYKDFEIVVEEHPYEIFLHIPLYYLEQALRALLMAIESHKQLLKLFLPDYENYLPAKMLEYLLCL